MKQIIFSLYIEIPDNELDLFDKHLLKKETSYTNFNTKKEFLNNYNKLVDCKKTYADNLNLKFVLFKDGYDFQNFKEDYNIRYPFLTTYNIINFYKIHLLYEISKTYDEILYLDFDVVPLTKENFFNVWNFNNGICVYDNSYNVKKIESITNKTQTIRSPTAKYYNSQAMLIEKRLNSLNNVINTGIIGVNKYHLDKLNYFGDFKNDLYMMEELTKNYDIFPKKIVDFFGYDNETLFSVKLKENNVSVQWLNNEWHYFFDTQGYIPNETKFVHTINKRFDIVWRKMNA